MNSIRYRILAVAIATALIFVTSTAMADDLPSASELAEMEHEEPEAEASEDDAEDAEAAEDGDVAAEDEDAEADDDGDADAEDDEQRAVSETTLRDPISPVMSNSGSLGFHGISSALSPGPMLFQVGMIAEATGGSDILRHNDSHRVLAANVLVNASFHEFFAAHFGLQARNSLNTFGQPQSMLAQGDMTFGLTGRHPVSDGIWLGADLSLYLPAGFDSVGMAMGGTSVRPQLMASFDWDKMMGAQPDRYLPIITHLNIGYRVDNSERMIPEGMELNRIERHAYGISAYNMVEFGVGAEFPLPHVTPYLGWELGVPVSGADGVCDSDRALRCVSEVGGASYPQRMSVGAKAEPLQNLGVHFGFDMGLTSAHAEGLPATLPYNFNFGASWQIDPAGRQVQLEETEVEVEVEVEAPRGVLFGQISDQETGEPVTGARITYVDHSLSSQLSDDTTGVFESYGFAPAAEPEDEESEVEPVEIALELSHPAYETKQVSWTVLEEGTEEAEFLMEPLPREAVVRGSVAAQAPEEGVEADEADEEPQDLSLAGARVIIVSDDGTVYETETDGSGNFEQEIIAGPASVSAVADGYLTVGQFIEPEPESTANVSLTLRDFDGEWLAEVSDVQIGLNESVHFESGTGVLLDRSDELLDHVAALILSNADIGRIEIQAHTDDAGDEGELLSLSEEQASAVRDALVQRGLSPDRLDTEGMGQARPLVPNTSSRNRSLNRRIEFHLVD